MGLLGKLWRTVSGSGARLDDDQDDGEYRCISCGAYHDRNYHSCPECGGQYVAPTKAGDE